jgi:hypothetical protein
MNDEEEKIDKKLSPETLNIIRSMIGKIVILV